MLFRSAPGEATPERCVEGHYLERALVGSIAADTPRRHLAEKGKVEIGGRDLRIYAGICRRTLIS